MTELSMSATAAAVGLSAERFRKVWRDYVARYAFPKPTPRPALNSKRERFIWNAEAVEAWKKARRGALGPAEVTPLAANDENLAAGHFPQVAHHRARLETLRQRRA